MGNLIHINYTYQTDISCVFRYVSWGSTVEMKVLRQEVQQLTLCLPLLFSLGEWPNFPVMPLLTPTREGLMNVCEL